MVQMRTLLSVADNSGATQVQCIKVLGGTHHYIASLGDVIVVSVKKALPGAKVKKGEVYLAVIVRTTKPYKRTDGSIVKFDGNAAVIINKQYEIIGSRVFGSVPRELRRNFMKIISLAPEVL